MNDYGSQRGMGVNLPPVFKGILIINVSVLLLELILSGINFGEVNLGQYFRDIFALNPISMDTLFSEWKSFWPWQLITFQFMHSLSDIFHLLFNMYILWIFGSQLERLWGGDKFLGFYLLAGIAGGITQLMFIGEPIMLPTGEMVLPSTVGASAGVIGTVIGLATLYPNQQIFMFPLFIPIKLRWLAVVYVASDLFFAITGTGGTTAVMAHLGGAAAGYLLVKYGDKIGIFSFMSSIFDIFRKKNSYSTPSGSFTQQNANVHKMYNKKQTYKKPHDAYNESGRNPKTYNIQGEEVTQRRIDEILDKITETGYQNLTSREKDILVELSKKVK